MLGSFPLKLDYKCLYLMKSPMKKVLGPTEVDLFTYKQIVNPNPSISMNFNTSFRQFEY